MYGERLIPKLAYGLRAHAPAAKEAPRGRGVPRNCKILEGVQRIKENPFPDMQ